MTGGRLLGGVLPVGATGLGCMGMSGFYQTADQHEAAAVLLRALDLGVTLLDTADVYGPRINEELIGRVLRARRCEAMIATKFGLVPGEGYGGSVINGRPDHVRQARDASLWLRTDHVDRCFQHRLDRDVPIEETVGAMAELVAAGKVRHLGRCDSGPTTLRRAGAVYPITALQTEWSLWSRDIEPAVLPVARELGIGITPYSPLGRGFLTGTITRTADLGDGDRRRQMPRFGEGNLATNLDATEVVRRLAAERGCTPARLALAWLLSRGPTSCPPPARPAARTSAPTSDSVADAVAGVRLSPATTHMECHRNGPPRAREVSAPCGATSTARSPAARAG